MENQETFICEVCKFELPIEYQHEERAGAILPFELKEVISIPCDNPLQLENKIHKHFAGKRTEGEWFKLNESDLETIRAFR